MHLVKETFDAHEAHVKLAIKHNADYAWDVKKANEELDEANSQVAALKAETAARAAEAAEASARELRQLRHLQRPSTTN